MMEIVESGSGRIAVSGVNTRGCTFVVVPHDHAKPPFRVERVARGIRRTVLTLDTGAIGGRFTLVMLDAAGKRHLLGHGTAGI